MSDEFTLHPAKRTNVRPLIGFYGKSGSGKTMSALLYARGLAGPVGRIALIDTENGRGGMFADVIPGGYDGVDLTAPFSPARYLAALNAVLAQQPAAILIDSMSHVHDGEGGLLDMHEAELDRRAGNDWGKRERCAMAAWIAPKAAFKQLLYAIIRLPVPLICCLRADEKTHVVKGPDGKDKIVTDKFSTPVMEKRFIFEMLVNFEVYQHGNGDGETPGLPGCVIVRKEGPPTMTPAGVYPKLGHQVTVEDGARMAAWCANATAAPATGAGGGAERARLRRELWDATGSIHGCSPKPTKKEGAEGGAKLERWLQDERLLDPYDTLAGLTDEAFAGVVKAAKAKFAEVPA